MVRLDFERHAIRLFIGDVEVRGWLPHFDCPEATKLAESVARAIAEHEKEGQQWMGAEIAALIDERDRLRGELASARAQLTTGD